MEQKYNVTLNPHTRKFFMYNFVCVCARTL